jgi:CheY-like chemotaxis protein
VGLASPAILSITAVLKILVVEDHLDSAAVMKYILTQAGHSVCHATSVASAIEAVTSQSFDVILSDIGLPDGDGVSLIKAVRQLCGAPAIALSGYGMREEIERCLRAGFSKHLIKPVTLDTLVETIAKVHAAAKAA